MKATQRSPFRKASFYSELSLWDYTGLLNLVQTQLQQTQQVGSWFTQATSLTHLLKVRPWERNTQGTKGSQGFGE